MSCGRQLLGGAERAVLTGQRIDPGNHPVGGQPAVLAFRGRTLAGLIVFTLRGELIQAVHVIGDPRKLGFVSAQLSGLQ